MSTGAVRVATLNVLGNIGQIRALDQAALLRAESTASTAYSTANTELVIVVLAAVLLAVALGRYIARSVALPLVEVKRSLEETVRYGVTSLEQGMAALAAGNLTVSARGGATAPTYESRDEIGLDKVQSRLTV